MKLLRVTGKRFRSDYGSNVVAKVRQESSKHSADTAYSEDYVPKRGHRLVFLRRSRHTFKNFGLC